MGNVVDCPGCRKPLARRAIMGGGVTLALKIRCLRCRDCTVVAVNGVPEAAERCQHPHPEIAGARCGALLATRTWRGDQLVIRCLDRCKTDWPFPMRGEYREKKFLTGRSAPL